jgi:uncharacterized membrane protein YczE
MKYMIAKQDTFSLLIKLLVFVVGSFLLALGCAVMIKANLGVSTWDVLHTGSSKKLSISIGLAIIMIGFILIGLRYILDRLRPQLGTFMNAIIVGVFLNLILSYQLIPTFNGFWLNFIFLLVGITLMGFGSGMYVGSGIGAGPRDGFTIALANRLQWSIRLVRTLLEAIVLLVGWLLGGGPVEVGTFLSLIIIGPILQASLFFWRKQVEKLNKLEMDVKSNKKFRMIS